jgi:hypothetical protein
LSKKDRLSSKEGVQDFIVKWHTVGAALADTNPKIVNDLMQVFMDPSSSPSTPIGLGEASGPMSDFLVEYYLFVQYMDNVDVSTDDKIDILRKLFDGSTLNFAGEKSRRSMRHGLRRRQGVGEIGLPDTGIELDDASQLGHDALAEILGSAGTLDPLGQLHPQDGETSDVGELTPDDLDVADELDDVDQSACLRKKAAIADATKLDSAETVDQFVQEVFGGELPIDAHADEFANES